MAHFLPAWFWYVLLASNCLVAFTGWYSGRLYKRLLAALAGNRKMDVELATMLETNAALMRAQLGAPRGVAFAAKGGQA